MKRHRRRTYEPEPPVALPTDPVTMLYRRVDQTDGRAVWFRRLFVEVVAVQAIKNVIAAKTRLSLKYFI